MDGIISYWWDRGGLVRLHLQGRLSSDPQKGEGEGLPVFTGCGSGDCTYGLLHASVVVFALSWGGVSLTCQP